MVLHRNIHEDRLEEQLNVEKFQPYRKTIALGEYNKGMGYSLLFSKATVVLKVQTLTASNSSLPNGNPSSLLRGSLFFSQMVMKMKRSISTLWSLMSFMRSLDLLQVELLYMPRTNIFQHLSKLMLRVYNSGDLSLLRLKNSV